MGSSQKLQQEPALLTPWLQPNETEFELLTSKTLRQYLLFQPLFMVTHQSSTRKPTYGECQLLKETVFQSWPVSELQSRKRQGYFSVKCLFSTQGQRANKFNNFKKLLLACILLGRKTLKRDSLKVYLMPGCSKVPLPYQLMDAEALCKLKDFNFCSDMRNGQE